MMLTGNLKSKMVRKAFLITTYSFVRGYVPTLLTSAIWKFKEERKVFNSSSVCGDKGNC